MSVLVGSIAIAPGSPMPSAGARSKIGVQVGWVAPPSRVRQTPPHAVPIKMMLELFGLTAMAVTWPFAVIEPWSIGLGPIGFQTVPFKLIFHLAFRLVALGVAAHRRPIRQ